jgi:hypothetical protein
MGGVIATDDGLRGKLPRLDGKTVRVRSKVSHGK